MFPNSPLPFYGGESIDATWIAIFAEMDVGDIHTVIVAFDMLPGLALFAEDRVAIVIIVVADATDGVRLLLRDDRVSTGAVEGGRGQRDGDRSWLRG